MQELIGLILASGRTALELAFYLLLPVMVTMLALMKVLEARGLLARTARLLAPPLRPFGVPGSGVFAILQLLLVSFAAPVATFAVMDRDGTHQRRIAAALAMILALPQANVIFPLAAAGLNLTGLLATSLAGGLIAAALTYYLFARSLGSEADLPAVPSVLPAPRPRASTWGLMIGGGQEAVQIVLNSIPALLLALLFVNLLKSAGVIALAETVLTPGFALLGLPGTTVLPLATKYTAGGTAMMGVSLDLVKSGAMSIADLNRLAGFVINPLDMVGVAVLAASGPRVAAVARPAVAGAAAGILIGGTLHLFLF